MSITVIVPTFKRPQLLKKCLEGLSKQSQLPEEVIVTIRDIDQATWEFIHQASYEQLVVKPIEVQAPGQVAALNTGIAAASGDIIAFIDDDAVPHQDWLERIEAHFATNTGIGGVGGRDWVYLDHKLQDGSQEHVGKVQWIGRVVPNHHIGVGKAREVDWLKGTNMSYRKSAIANHTFDHRLKGQGAQGRNDLSFCLKLKQDGWKLIYDPLVAVDHYPGQQFDDNRRDGFREESYINECHNEALALLDYLPPLRRQLYLIWAILIGTRSRYGLVQCLRFLPREGNLVWTKWKAATEGYAQGWRTWSQSH